MRAVKLIFEMEDQAVLRDLQEQMKQLEEKWARESSPPTHEPPRGGGATMV